MRAKSLHRRVRSRRREGLVAVEHALDLTVVEAPVGAHRRGKELGALHDSVVIEPDVDREREAVLARVERADLVGQLLGQHGQHPVDQVDARRALTGLGVDRRVPRHVVTHVGDVHAQPHEPVDPVDRDRVVEVPRIHRVDGEGEPIAHVSALGLSRECGLHVEPDLLGGAQDLVGELGSKPVLANDDLDLDALFAFAPHDLVDHALGRVIAARIADDSRDHDVAGRGVTDGVRRDEDVVAYASVGGNDDADRAVAFEAAHDLGDGSLEDAHDHAASPLATALGVGPQHDRVAVHGAVGVASGDVEVAVLSFDEAVAAAGQRDAADHLPASTTLARRLASLAGATRATRLPLAACHPVAPLAARRFESTARRSAGPRVAGG